METDSNEVMNTELKGSISIKLNAGKTLDEFCEKNFENYNSDQYEAVAIRLYYEKEIIVTLYALDKVRQEGSNYNIHKIPVKKFKTSSLGLAEMLAFVQEFNFTLSAGNYPLEDMEVINK